MLHEYITTSENETFNIGLELGKKLQKGAVVALFGELGTGKTIIAKGIAHSIGIDPEEITSPTFTLFETHSGKLPLYHFDLYRIEDDREFDNLFFEEYWEGDGISVIEWAEKAISRLPDKIITIKLNYTDSLNRRIIVEYPYN